MELGLRDSITESEKITFVRAHIDRMGYDDGPFRGGYGHAKT